ncbi:hypothetical protein IGI37_003323 [Enterococcus sp. AZ194]|uniref:SGNH/GDSL hydrolase family protein n=1 Tax=Enterococcus sp. AZ194 TaxID=2774629 RepID=UPI003F28B2BA
MKILFNGDSITDACRREDPDFGLGYGYPLFLTALLNEYYNNQKIEVINRGISGDQIAGMNSRWQEDCLDYQPDLVSILIGINDVGFNEEAESFGTLEETARYETIYREVLDKTKAAGIEKIVLMEPFVMPNEVDRSHWRKDLDPKIQVVRKLAAEYNTVLVSLDGLLNQLCLANGAEKYTRDGVHLVPLGNKVVAEAWMQAVTERFGKEFK